MADSKKKVRKMSGKTIVITTSNNNNNFDINSSHRLQGLILGAAL